MKLTYNQVIKALNDFADAHLEIETFGNGDLWEAVQHNQLGNFQYPLLWVVDKPATVGDKVFTWNFQVIYIDIVRKDETNENDVKSDAVQVLIDLIAYFEQRYLVNDVGVKWSQVQLVRGGTVELFSERFEDDLSGASISLGLRFPQIYNECVIPKT